MKRVGGTICCEYEDLLSFAAQTGRTQSAVTLLWNAIGKFMRAMDKPHRPRLLAANSGRLWCGPDGHARSDLRQDELHAGFVVDVVSLVVAAEHLDPRSVNHYGVQQHAFFMEWVEHLKGSAK